MFSIMAHLTNSEDDKISKIIVLALASSVIIFKIAISGSRILALSSQSRLSVRHRDISPFIDDLKPYIFWIHIILADNPDHPNHLDLLDHLGHIGHMENLDHLDQMGQLDHLDHLDHLDRLHHLDHLDPKIFSSEMARNLVRSLFWH